MDEPPILCTLTEERRSERREGLLASLFQTASERSLGEDRLELVFPDSSEILSLLFEVLRSERQCCRFLTFELVAEPELGPLRLTISGPPGTGDFLRTLS
jgi:hypothetical protein